MNQHQAVERWASISSTLLEPILRNAGAVFVTYEVWTLQTKVVVTEYHRYASVFDIHSARL